jgi:hypothetical protein
VFLGYSSCHLGYCCLDLSCDRVYISRHVRFYEQSFPFPDTDHVSAIPDSNPQPTSTSHFPALIHFPSHHPTAKTPSSSLNRSPYHQLPLCLLIILQVQVLLLWYNALCYALCCAPHIGAIYLTVWSFIFLTMSCSVFASFRYLCWSLQLLSLIANHTHQVSCSSGFLLVPDGATSLTAHVFQSELSFCLSAASTLKGNMFLWSCQ